MRTGNLEGFVDRTWQVVHDSGELAAAVMSYTISGLSGDTDVKYRLISRVVNGYNGPVAYNALINNDSGNNYGYQYVTSQNAAVAANRGTLTAILNAAGYCSALNGITFNDFILNAKSGSTRTGIVKFAFDISGTTVGTVQVNGLSWNNSVDNITSLQITGGQVGCIGIGSRFILLKEVHVPSGLRTGELDIRGTLKGAWQEVYRHTVSGSAETSITVSGLKGNTTDQILRVRVRAVGGYNGAGRYVLRFNNDTGNNYGNQYLQGIDTTVSAGRIVGNGLVANDDPQALGQVAYIETLLYLKSGFVRTGIHGRACWISGTTVGNMTLVGDVWANTVDEVTSLVFAGTTNNFGIGTEICIERLNL